VERYLEESSPAFDHAVSRATFEPSAWWPLGCRLVNPSGVVWFMVNESHPIVMQTQWRRSYSLPSGKQRRIEGKCVGLLNSDRPVLQQPSFT
jgi:hypothetical protein